MAAAVIRSTRPKERFSGRAAMRNDEAGNPPAL